MTNYQFLKQKRRAKRVRARLSSVAARPRLSVYRSNRYIYAQIIDDSSAKTLVFAHQGELAESKEKKLSKSQRAYSVGKIIGEKATAKKIKEVIFDRGKYKFHGRIKALADGAKETGLNF
ncbi:50S ribosomal protein L18 [Candidatus Gottesmanbacteria bacterium]|nr:50S ribosomal protein L18 [Candidatus Gottesmanbacteria bacterium]